MLPDLITKILDRAKELERRSGRVAAEEGRHRSSTDDIYFRGGADALRQLADELNNGRVPALKS